MSGLLEDSSKRIMRKSSQDLAENMLLVNRKQNENGCLVSITRCGGLQVIACCDAHCCLVVRRSFRNVVSQNSHSHNSMID